MDALLEHLVKQAALVFGGAATVGLLVRVAKPFGRWHPRAMSRREALIVMLAITLGVAATVYAVTVALGH